MSQSNYEANVVLALQALQNDPQLKVYRAATIYGVSNTTLRRRRDHVPARRDYTPKSRKLTDLEEQTIVQYILDLHSRSFPPRLRDVEDMANKLLADRDAPPVGKRWASNFVKRKPELKTRSFRRYDYQRAKCEDPEIILGWFTLVQNIITKYGIVESDIYNFHVGVHSLVVMRIEELCANWSLDKVRKAIKNGDLDRRWLAKP